MCNINTMGLGLRAVSNMSDANQYNAMQLEYQAAKNKAILENLAQKTKDLNNSYASDYEANVLKRQQDYIKNLQAKASVQASMASKGLAGNSINNMYLGYERANAVNNYLYARDLQLNGLQYGDKLSALRTSAVKSLDTEYPYRKSTTSSIFGGTSGLFSVFRRSQANNQGMQLL